jgi:hypothetical protein
MPTNSSVAIRSPEKCPGAILQRRLYAAIFFPFNAALPKVSLNSASSVAI